MAARDQTQTTNDILVDLDAPELPAPALDPDQGIEAIETAADELKKLPKGAVLNEDGSVTLPLLYPRSVKIKSSGGVREETFERFVLYRLNGADINAVRAASEATSHVVMLARSLRKHVAIVKALYEKLDSADIKRSAEVLDSFF